MKTTIYILILILFLAAKEERVNKLREENQLLIQQLKNCDYAYTENIRILDSITEVNRQWNNHVVRMQYIAGIKNPDTVFTWKEKVIHPINTKRILKFKTMAKKRLFQILDDMNIEDIKNGTRLVSVSGSFISADKVKLGTKVAMGTDNQALYDLTNDKVIPVLLLVDRKEYNKRMNNQ